MKLSKKVISFILAASMLMTAASAAVVNAATKKLDTSSARTEVNTSQSNSYGLVDDVQDGQILQCWNWSYNGIKNNMKKIAEQGFSAVQTSPIQTIKESTQGKSFQGSWWVYYQPSNFTIDTSSQNALGTKSDFKAMCEEAHKYGVKVIVDAVLNHMANAGDNTLSSTIPSDIRNDSNCWYSITQNTTNWHDRYDITHRCMGGLPDLNTSNSKIQNYEIAFLKECIDCGADGFRFDGAKHIEVPNDSSNASSNFWPTVLNAATSYAQSTRGFTPYYYGEILDDTGGGQSIVNEYAKYMSMTCNRVSNDIRYAVHDGNASTASRSDFKYKQGNDGDGSAPPANKAVLWNESHDTYADGASRSHSDSIVNRTWAIVGARAEACGMYFARPQSYSQSLGTASVTSWANKEVQAVNQFKNAMVGESEYISSSGSIVYNERGTSGVVLVNCSGTSASVNVTAKKMASGTYTDAVTGNTFTVSGGKITGQIGSTGIAVVYSGTKSPVATISQQGGNFKTDTLNLTLGLENATSGTYQIDGGAVQTYTGTASITIGSGVSYGSTVTVKLTATGEGGTKEYSYTFKKVDPNAVRIIDFSNDHTVYLWNTAGWSTVNCYSWPTGGDGATIWPGTGMTKVDTFGGYDLYKITTPSDETNIIFNDGSTQTDDLTIQTSMVVFDNGKNTWVDANSIDDDVLASKDGNNPTATSATTATTPTATIPSGTYFYGDVSLDGDVNVQDATLIQKYAAKSKVLTELQIKAADVNSDSDVTVQDATLVQKLLAKIITSLPSGNTFTYGTVTTSTSATSASKVTIKLVDGTPQGWLSDAGALFVIVADGTSYSMSGGSGTWTAEIPATAKNITINRNSPESGETWNSWTTTVSGTTFTATSSGVGSWS